MIDFLPPSPTEEPSEPEPTKTMNTTPELHFQAWYEDFHNLFSDIPSPDREDIAQSAFDRARGVRPLAFPPKPKQFTWHNPDNLTPEQVGEGWRLLVNEEVDGRFAGVAHLWMQSTAWRRGEDTAANNRAWSFRVPIATPFPDGSFIQDGKLVKPWKPLKPVPLEWSDVHGCLFGEVERHGDRVPAPIYYAPFIIRHNEAMFRNQYGQTFTLSYAYMAESGRWFRLLPGKTEWEPCSKLP